MSYLFGAGLQARVYERLSADATLAGLVFLGQGMSWLELVGIGLVIAASIGAVRAAAKVGGGTPG